MKSVLGGGGERRGVTGRVPEDNMIAEDKRIQRMIEVSRLYYEEGYSQKEIAQKLSVSRPLVSVILNEARECGVVSITIRDVSVTAEQIVDKLKKSYGIGTVITVPDAENDDLTNRRIAETAYNYCFSKTNDGKRVGIGWGSIVGKMVDYAETLDNSPDVRGAIFPLAGGVNSVTRGYHTNELVRIFALKTGRQPYFLYIPALNDTSAELEFLKQTEAFTAIEDEWDFMEQAMVSVSNFPSYPDLGVRTIYGNALTEKKAVGRMLAHYFDSQGRIISPASDSTLQASIRQLRQTDVTAICSNQVKPQCVIGALRTGIIDKLVISQGLAEKVSDITY